MSSNKLLKLFLVCACFTAAAAPLVYAQDKTEMASGELIRHQPVILDELKRLNITTLGEPRQYEETLPEDLMKGARWGVVASSCRAGGYDLSAFAGKKVHLTTYSIIEPNDDSKMLRVAVVTQGGNIACVYKSNGAIIPGVYPATENFADLDGPGGTNGETPAFNEGAMEQQGTIIPCEVCVILYPKQYEKSPEACPICKGAKEHFQPAQMMTREMARMRLREIDLDIQEFLHETVINSLETAVDTDRLEELQNLYKRKLIHLLVHDFNEVELVKERILRLDELIKQ